MFGRDSLRLALALSRRTLARWHQGHATSVHTSRCITSMRARVDTTTQTDGARLALRCERGEATWRSAVSRLCPGIETGPVMSTPDTLHLATPRSHSVLRRQRSTLTRAHSVSLPVQNMLAVCPLSSGLAVGTGQFSWSCFLQFVPLRPPTLIARASAQRRAPRRGPASSQTSPRSSPRRLADQT